MYQIIFHKPFRFLGSFNIQVGSQSKQRGVHKERHGSNWSVKIHPFLKKIDNVKYEAVNTPWSIIEDFKLHVVDRLDQLSQ